MAMNIGETLLHRPENRSFRLALEPFKISGYFQIHINLATLGESLYVPPKSRGKSSFIQQRRMQQVGNCADLFAELLYQSRAVVDRMGGLGEKLDVASHRSQFHYLSCQHLPRTDAPLSTDSP